MTNKVVDAGQEGTKEQIYQLLETIRDWEAGYRHINNLVGSPEWVGRIERVLAARHVPVSAPVPSPDASKEMVILRPCKCGHGWESHEPGRCNESLCRCEEFRPVASPEAPAPPIIIWGEAEKRLAKFIAQRESRKFKTLDETLYHQSKWERILPEAREMLDEVFPPETRARLGLSGRAE